MKTTALSLSVFILACLLAGSVNAQSAHGTTPGATEKFGCISFNELMTIMPEFKKADTLLAEFGTTLQQRFDAYKMEYSEQARVLSGPDTAKYTAQVLVIKRQSLAELLAKLNGFNQEAETLLNQKKVLLLQPIQQKAEAAIQSVSKDYGFAFVFEKDNLHVYPPATDILPLVKKKLGLL